jgi:hypothetical protein
LAPIVWRHDRLLGAITAKRHGKSPLPQNNAGQKDRQASLAGRRGWPNTARSLNRGRLRQARRFNRDSRECAVSAVFVPFDFGVHWDFQI